MMPEMVTDKTGRKIQLRRIGVLEQLRLFKALGPQLSANDMYMSLSMIVASAEMIDGVPVPFPSSEASLEALLERLGDGGIEAIQGATEQPSLTTVMAEAGNS